MISKLALGTVQFGMNYGINNRGGQPNLSDVGEILEYAKNKGIDTLDTAALYGSSEAVLGQCELSDFKLISKLQPCKAKAFRQNIENTLQNLNRKEIYAYLFHHFSTFLDDESLIGCMKEAKEKGEIRKFGFSLYNPSELELILDRGIDVDIVQLPYNVFDQRFSKHLDSLKSDGVEVHVRSIFLQGLFFMESHEIPAYFESIIPRLKSLNSYDLRKASICLNFVLLNPNIDKVVLGVDNLEQLKENISLLAENDLIKEIYEEVQSLQVDDEMIINPSNWELK